MKNRLLGITMFLAVVVIALTFTACNLDDDGEVTLLFTNNSSYRIFLTFTNPSSTEILNKPLNSAAPAETLTVTVTKKTKWGWSLPDITGNRDDYVIVEATGAGANFKNNPDGLAQNKIDTVQLDE